MGKGSAGISIGQGKCIKETDRAILVEFEDDDSDDLWIPKTQVHDDSDVYADGHLGDVIVKEWWAEKQGLV